jgi:hypothetical protein
MCSGLAVDAVAGRPCAHASLYLESTLQHYLSVHTYVLVVHHWMGLNCPAAVQPHQVASR